MVRSGLLLHQVNNKNTILHLVLNEQSYLTFLDHKKFVFIAIITTISTVFQGYRVGIEHNLKIFIFSTVSCSKLGITLPFNKLL